MLNSVEWPGAKPNTVPTLHSLVGSGDDTGGDDTDEDDTDEDDASGQIV